MQTNGIWSVLLIFLDGVGIGERKETNPFSKFTNLEPLAHFRGEISDIPFSGKLALTDPRLGIEGRPQSASGQTTIYTGINIPKTLGYHKQGFPNEPMREIIKKKSVFLQLKQNGVEPNVFANAYTPKFFTETPRWKSATTCAVEAAGMQFRKLPDLLGRKAIFRVFANEDLIARGFDAPLFSPREAAQILADLTKEFRFTLYEHFITDKIGHDQDFEKAQIHLPKVAEFVREVLKAVDLEKTTVILTSDHGNLEDLSVRNHTLNDVPTIIWGRKKDEVSLRIKDLTDITPAIIDLLS